MFKLFKELDEIKQEGRKERERIDQEANTKIKEIKEETRKHKEELDKEFNERMKKYETLGEKLKNTTDANEMKDIFEQMLNIYKRK